MEEAAVGVGERDASARHDARGDVEEFCHRDVGEASGGAAFAERCDEVAREAGAVDVDADADDGGGVEHGVDAGFRVVAHDEAAELQACRQKALGGIVPQFDGRVVVFQIRGDAACAEVAPRADDGVAEESVVGFVGVGENDGVVDFAAYLRVGADGCGAVDFRAHVDGGAVADGDGAAHDGAFHHFGAVADIDRTVLDVDDGAFDSRAGRYEQSRAVADDGDAVGDWGAGASGCHQREVAVDDAAVEHEDVIEAVDGDDVAAVVATRCLAAAHGYQAFAGIERFARRKGFDGVGH